MASKIFSVKLGSNNKTIISSKNQEIFLNEVQINDMLNLGIPAEKLGKEDSEVKGTISNAIYDINNIEKFRKYFQKNSRNPL